MAPEAIQDIPRAMPKVTSCIAEGVMHGLTYL